MVDASNWEDEYQEIIKLESGKMIESFLREWERADICCIGHLDGRVDQSTHQENTYINF